MKAYVAVHKDNVIRLNSRSGGTFAALSKMFLDKTQGCIYGAALQDNFEVEHIRVTDENNLWLLFGSKYVQSNLCKALPLLRQDFSENRDVLFSGTPCQVAAIKELIPHDYTGNILLIDIVCHSVPSPEIYRKFIAKYGRIKGFVFRNKELFGWRENISTIKMQKRKIHTLAYCNIFYNPSNMRPSCYKCPWKKKRSGDISIGDCWNIENVAPDLDDDFGVSVALINSENGEKWFDKIKDVMCCREVDSVLVTKQQALNKPFDIPFNRNVFWNDYHALPFEKFEKKYGKMSVKKRVRIIVSGIKTKLKKIKLPL